MGVLLQSWLREVEKGFNSALAAATIACQSLSTLAEVKPTSARSSFLARGSHIHKTTEDVVNKWILVRLTLVRRPLLEHRASYSLTSHPPLYQVPRISPLSFCISPADCLLKRSPGHPPTTQTVVSGHTWCESGTDDLPIRSSDLVSASVAIMGSEESRKQSIISTRLKGSWPSPNPRRGRPSIASRAPARNLSPPSPHLRARAFSDPELSLHRHPHRHSEKYGRYQQYERPPPPPRVITPKEFCDRKVMGWLEMMNEYERELRFWLTNERLPLEVKEGRREVVDLIEEMHYMLSLYQFRHFREGFLLHEEKEQGKDEIICEEYHPSRDGVEDGEQGHVQTDVPISEEKERNPTTDKGETLDKKTGSTETRREDSGFESGSRPSPVQSRGSTDSGLGRTSPLGDIMAETPGEDQPEETRGRPRSPSDTNPNETPSSTTQPSPPPPPNPDNNTSHLPSSRINPGPPLSPAQLHVIIATLDQTTEPLGRLGYALEGLHEVARGFGRAGAPVQILAARARRLGVARLARAALACLRKRVPALVEAMGESEAAARDPRSASAPEPASLRGWLSGAIPAPDAAPAGPPALETVRAATGELGRELRRYSGLYGLGWARTRWVLRQAEGVQQRAKVLLAGQLAAGGAADKGLGGVATAAGELVARLEVQSRERVGLADEVTAAALAARCRARPLLERAAAWLRAGPGAAYAVEDDIELMERDGRRGGHVGGRIGGEWRPRYDILALD